MGRCVWKKRGDGTWRPECRPLMRGIKVAPQEGGDYGYCPLCGLPAVVGKGKQWINPTAR